MDQSVAIQETLAEGEYCIIISFPALRSQPQVLPVLGSRIEDVYMSMCLCVYLLSSLPLSHQGRRKTVFTKYLLSTGVFFQPPVKLGFIIPISQMGKAQRGEATCLMSHSEPVCASAKQGRCGGLGWESPGLLFCFLCFPLTLSSRQCKECCVRETAGRAVSWGLCATAWNMEAKNMREWGVWSLPVWATGLFFMVPSSWTSSIPLGHNLSLLE